jgi:hypothetical protein
MKHFKIDKSLDVEGVTARISVVTLGPTPARKDDEVQEPKQARKTAPRKKKKDLMTEQELFDLIISL